MARPPSPSCWDSGKAPGERRTRAAHPPSARLSGAPWRGRRGGVAFGLRCRMLGGRHVCRRRSPMRSCSLLPTGASPRPFRRSGGAGAGGEVSFAPSYCDEEIPHKEYTLSSPWRILCSSGEGRPASYGFSQASFRLAAYSRSFPQFSYPVRTKAFWRGFRDWKTGSL